MYNIVRIFVYIVIDNGLETVEHILIARYKYSMRKYKLHYEDTPGISLLY